MTSNLYKVFVYGTLKKGEPNYHVFENAKDGYFKFLYNATTIQKYPLIIATEYNVPFLLYKPGVGNYIKGEIYEVNENVLKDLDALEDHPNFYIREEHTFNLVNTENSHQATAWIYFVKNFRENLLNQPMYDDYHSKGDHGKEYVARYHRKPVTVYNHKAEILDDN